MTLKLAVLAPVSTNKYNKRILAAIKPVVPSDVVVDAFNLSPKEAQRHIENRIDLVHNAYSVVKTARRIQEKGYDGIWLSDFDMCGWRPAAKSWIFRLWAVFLLQPSPRSP